MKPRDPNPALTTPLIAQSLLALQRREQQLNTAFARGLQCGVALVGLVGFVVVFLLLTHFGATP